MTRRLIGSGTTDSNGRISVPYTGTGAGKIQLVAVNGNLESETYVLIDAPFFDKGVDTDHKTTSTTQSTGSWYNGSGNLTVEYSSNGTTVTHSEDNTTVRHFYYNDTSISTVKISGINTLLNHSSIEFDLTAVAGTPQIYLTDGTNNRTLNLSSTGHYKIVFDGSVIKQYIDDVEVPLNNYAMTGNNIRFSFLLNEQDESFTFKNLVIYPS